MPTSKRRFESDAGDREASSSPLRPAPPKRYATPPVNWKSCLNSAGALYDGQVGDGREDALAEFVVLAVADDGVAEVEAHEHASGRIEFEHAAQVRGEVSLALVLEEADDARRAAQNDGRLPHAVRVGEAHEAGARLGEDAELLEALADLQAELRLLGAPARDVRLPQARRVEVAFGLDGDVVCNVVGDARAEAERVLRAAEEVGRRYRERRELRADFQLRRVVLLRARGRVRERDDDCECGGLEEETCFIREEGTPVHARDSFARPSGRIVWGGRVAAVYLGKRSETLLAAPMITRVRRLTPFGAGDCPFEEFEPYSACELR